MSDKVPPMVEVKFNANYIASRGPGIAGVEGSVQTLRMSPSLKALIDKGTLELVGKPKAATRSKATKKTGTKR